MKRMWIRLSLAFSAIILLFIVMNFLSTFVLVRITGQPSGRPFRIDPPAESEPITPDQAREIRRAFLIRLPQSLLIVAAIITVLGLAAGVIISRSFALPLQDLASAARAVGAGDLARRVTIRRGLPQEVEETAHAFNQMTAALQQEAVLRRNLMADVAHELRTPLTVLQGNLRAILDDVYQMDKEEVTHLYDQTRHLTRLVEDLRTVALAEARQLPLNFHVTDVVPLLQDSCAAFEPVAAEKGVTVKVSLPDSPLTVRVDDERLKQVVLNLLSNAERHTPAGGNITVSALALEEGVSITVSDTGEGITPEHLPHVFDRFYQADPARSREFGGSGLGLAIVKAIVEAHDGQVTARSPGQGQGASMIITLPKAG